MDNGWLEPASSAPRLSQNAADINCDDPTSSWLSSELQLQDVVAPSTAEDSDLCRLLSSSQQAAIAILHGLDDTHILAWLRLLRSLLTDCDPNSFRKAISRQQLEAMAVLTDCPDDAILSSLRTLRRSISHVPSDRTMTKAE